jgi:hypothetical protein
LQLYVKDLKAKREKALKDKRDINVTEEDDLDFFKNYCRQFFGQHQDLWDADDTLLLAQIWEEIQLEGEKQKLDIFFSFLFLLFLFLSISPCVKRD